jgi:hypothetical protein
MEGHTTHHNDPASFSAHDLTVSESAGFKVLVEQYFVSGFTDPGIVPKPGIMSQADIVALARRFPTQFHSYYQTIPDESFPSCRERTG